MKDKILSALKTKYASFGLGKEALDRVASQKAKTVTTEDGIEAGISDVETMTLIAKELQGSADVLRTRNAQIQKELEDSRKKPEPGKNADDDNAQKFSAMEEKLDRLMAKFEESEKKARRAETISRLNDRMKELGCTNDFIRKTTISGAEISDSDTVDSLAEKLKKAYDANCRDAFGDGYQPPKGGGGASEDAPDYTKMAEALRRSGDLPSKEK